MKPTNDNTEHPLLKEFYHWQIKSGVERKYPKSLLHTKFSERERYLANHIWFYKFDINYNKMLQDKIRSKLKVIE